MRRFLTRTLAPVIDSEQETRRHILWWITARVLLFTLLTGLTLMFRERGYAVILPPVAVTATFLVGLYLFSLISALLVGKTSWSARRFGMLQLLADTIFTALLVYATGCSQSSFTPILILPVISGGLILYRLGGLFLAAVTTLLFGALLAAEGLGWIPPYFHAAAYKPPGTPLTGVNLFAVYGLIFFLAALLSGQLARRLRVTEEKLTRTAREFDRLSVLYKQIFDDITTGIITADQHDFITSFNRAAERITGFSREQILGQPFSRSFPGILLAENRARNVCDFRRSDGQPIRIGYSFSHLNMPHQEEQQRWKVITLQDISQIERMEQQVREAEKMAAIGEMSASIAHDFRNPLAAISGSAQLLTMDAGGSFDAATLKTLLGIILRESNRMAKTITDFLQFARPAPIQPEWFDLGRLVDEVIEGLKRGPLAVAAARIHKEIPGNLDCWADRQQVQTMLCHLLENACQAIDGQPGAIVVAAGERDLPTQGRLTIEVRDQGPGIAPELRDKVFAPFFSGRTDGTGLGLAIVRQIAENHRGTVEIADSPEFACILRLSLPLPQAAATPP